VTNTLVHGLFNLMMTKIITNIEPQIKNLKRVNIYLDGEYGFGISAILAAWLKVGQEITEEKIESLILEDQLEIATQKALHFISYRPRSTNEVRKNLEGKDIPPMVIDQVIQKLVDLTLLDDQGFAEQWVENRNEFRPRSRMALRMELRNKGISEEITDQVLENLDEDDLAYKAGCKYSNRLKKLDYPNFRKKLSSHLARRGFGYSSINQVVDLIWKETEKETNHMELNIQEVNT